MEFRYRERYRVLRHGCFVGRIMIKRTIEISNGGSFLHVRQRQLKIRRVSEEIGSIPCEDIGVIVVDHAQTTYSHSALVALAQADATLIVCGADHLPTAMLLPVSEHSRVVDRLHDQLQVTIPTAKRLWKQIVQAKIRGQAKNLDSHMPAKKKLNELATKVRAGDPTNLEAQAARVYWQNWLPDEARFRRDYDQEGVNAMLNYGYAVIRAAVSRALVAAGLLPALGLKHCHRGNAFALAMI